MELDTKTFKCAMLGPHSTGKTSILNFLHFKTFDPNQQSTIGSNFLAHTINVGNETVELQIWDTAGQEKFRSIRSYYYREAVAGICVYDLSDPQTLTELNTFIVDYTNTVQIEHPLIIIIGNKVDLVEKDAKSIQLGKEYASQHNYPFFLTSAKNGDGINQVFDFISKTIITSLTAPLNEESIPLTPEENTSSQCC